MDHTDILEVRSPKNKKLLQTEPRSTNFTQDIHILMDSFTDDYNSKNDK